MKTGILLAAGSAQRWGGNIAKELVPLGPGKCLIDNSFECFKAWGADNVVVATSSPKIATHAFHFSRDFYKDIPIALVVPPPGTEMWASILTCLPFAREDNLLLMADTLIPAESFTQVPTKPLTFGMFVTEQPQRFSCLRSGSSTFVTKPANWPLGSYKAWGSVAFSKEVANYWQKRQFFHFDQAFNAAMSVFDYTHFALSAYEDFADFDVYKKYIKEQYSG